MVTVRAPSSTATNPRKIAPYRPVRTPRRLLFQLLGKTVNADWLSGGTMTEYYAKWHATTCPCPTSLNCGSEAGSVQMAGRPLSLYSGQRGAKRQPLAGCSKSNTPQVRRSRSTATLVTRRVTSVVCLSASDDHRTPV